jgi:hypothetical protein
VPRVNLASADVSTPPTLAPQIFLTSDRLPAIIHRGTALAPLNGCELAILSPAELVCVGARKSCIGRGRLSIPGSSVELAEVDLRAYVLRKVLRIAETLHCFSWVVGFRCVDAYQSHLFVRADDDCVAGDSDAKEFTEEWARTNPFAWLLTNPTERAS